MRGQFQRDGLRRVVGRHREGGLHGPGQRVAVDGHDEGHGIVLALVERVQAAFVDAQQAVELGGLFGAEEAGAQVGPVGGQVYLRAAGGHFNRGQFRGRAAQGGRVDGGEVEGREVGGEGEETG